MNFTELFIRRPVMTTLVMAGILIFGLVAYRQLPVSDLPAVDYPTISVSASLSGASPETMASSVATPLEKQFSTIPGVETMTSTSTQGSTQISLQFALSRDIDAAAQDVQAAISQAQRQLPRDVLPPSFRKVDPSSSPILYYALRTTTLPLPQLNEYAETFLAQRLSTVDGVAQVQVFGSMKYAVRIQLDPQAADRPQHRHRRGLDRDRERQRQPADRHSLGHRQGLLGREPRSAQQRRGFRRPGRGLPRRRAGAPPRPRPSHRQRPGHQARQLVQRPALRGVGGAAPAGDQYRGCGGAGQSRGRAAPSPDPARDRSSPP